MGTRREFLSNTSKVIAATGLSGFSAGSVLVKRKTIAANERIVVGLIGSRGMGFADLQDAIKQPGVECGAICDVDKTILDQRSAEVAKTHGKKPLTYTDFRKLLENKDIDAVIIGTPDHWHCLPMVYACEAGKDVYVEKPLANSIAECEQMVIATRKYNRVVQVGQQQRSGEHWKSAMNFIKSGKIGQLRKVKIWGNFNYGIGQPIVPDESVPNGVDFEMWLGPAHERSFNNTRFHGSWRMFWDYGGGLLTDWGVHLLDMALWSKEITVLPKSVMASGSNIAYKDHAHETFDTMSVIYQMDDYIITWDHVAGTQNGPYGRLYGLAFIGNDATLVIDRESWELFPEMENGNYKVVAIPKHNSHDVHEDHLKNWLECIKSRKDPACTVENGRLVALYAHMGNISARTNSQLQWDEQSKNFGTNSKANALITPEYRRPWVLPKLSMPQ